MHLETPLSQWGCPASTSTLAELILMSLLSGGLAVQVAMAATGRLRVADESLDGVRWLIAHKETPTLPSFKLTQIARTAQGVALEWNVVGTATHCGQRSANVGDPSSFVDVSGERTGTSYPDTSAPNEPAFHRVKATP